MAVGIRSLLLDGNENRELVVKLNFDEIGVELYSVDVPTNII